MSFITKSIGVVLIFLLAVFLYKTPLIRHIFSQPSFSNRNPVINNKYEQLNYDKSQTNKNNDEKSTPVSPKEKPIEKPPAINKPPPTKNLITRQAFALTQPIDKQIVALLNHANIDGIALQLGWPSLEPSDNNFSWEIIDVALKEAKSRGKWVTLYIAGTSGAGKSMPLWLKNAGVQTYTATNFLGKTHELAVPWDPTYLSQFTEFLNALSSHLASTGYSDTVARVGVGVPVTEMTILGCANNVISNTYPYDRSLYLSAWKQMIDAYEAAFPMAKKHVSAPVGFICSPNRETQFYREVMSYASEKYSDDFIPFAADLMTTGSARMTPYLDLVSGRGLAYQPIWFSTNAKLNRLEGAYPTNLLQTVCKGIANGADYIEIYAVDVLNTDATIQKGIQAVHDSSLCN